MRRCDLNNVKTSGPLLPKAANNGHEPSRVPWQHLPCCDVNKDRSVDVFSADADKTSTAFSSIPNSQEDPKSMITCVSSILELCLSLLAFFGDLILLFRIGLITSSNSLFSHFILYELHRSLTVIAIRSVYNVIRLILLNDRKYAPA